MDKDLRDDMLKLVRYKILFIKREYEHAFDEEEDLVSENMDGSAFTAWKVAEFIQGLAHEPHETRVPGRWGQKYPTTRYRAGKNGEWLTGLPDDDKKYLRVFYEVLDRYPREKFKYEERQIEVLEDIRDKIERKDGKGEPAKPIGGEHGAENPAEAAKDAFNEIVHRLYLSKETLDGWRNGFSQHSQTLANDIARLFNEHREVGHVHGPEIKANDIARVFKKPIAPFERRSFDRFTGKALGDLRIFRYTKESPDKLVEIPTPLVHSIWGQTREHEGEFRQRITGSLVEDNYIDPDDLDAIRNNLERVTVDLTFNGWFKELGIVSWASFYQNHSNQMRSIGYEVGPYLLWVNQLLDPDMTPTIGPLPIGLPGDQPVVRENQFILSCDFETVVDGKHFFNVYAMHIDFDFKKGHAKFAGPILKMKNERID